jgi:hypothetical protein
MTRAPARAALSLQLKPRGESLCCPTAYHLSANVASHHSSWVELSSYANQLSCFRASESLRTPAEAKVFIQLSYTYHYLLIKLLQHYTKHQSPVTCITRLPPVCRPCQWRHNHHHHYHEAKFKHYTTMMPLPLLRRYTCFLQTVATLYQTPITNLSTTRLPLVCQPRQWRHNHHHHCHRRLMCDMCRCSLL